MITDRIIENRTQKFLNDYFKRYGVCDYTMKQTKDTPRRKEYEFKFDNKIRKTRGSGYENHTVALRIYVYKNKVESYARRVALL